MDKPVAEEIENLKKDLYQKKEKIQDIKKLANKEIDRRFASDLEEFSEKELDSFLEESLAMMDKSVDPTPDKMSLSSHRKIWGKPIILLKRLLLKVSGVYINLLLDRQKKFNQQSMAFYRAIVLRLRRNRQKIKLVEQMISECEGNLIILSKKLEDLSNEEESSKNSD